METRAVFIDEDGNRFPYDKIVFEPADTHDRTFYRSDAHIPTITQSNGVLVPEREDKRILEAEFGAQEFKQSGFSCILGRVDAMSKGKRAGKKVKGMAF